MRMLPIHQSLHRHNHVLGAEREPALICGLIALLVGAGGMTVISVCAALVFYFAALMLLRRMAKADPMMTRVWFRHIRQQVYYPAKTSRWRTVGGNIC